MWITLYLGTAARAGRLTKNELVPTGSVSRPLSGNSTAAIDFRSRVWNVAL